MKPVPKSADGVWGDIEPPTEDLFPPRMWVGGGRFYPIRRFHWYRTDTKAASALRV